MIKNILVSLDEKIFKQLQDIKKNQGVPIVVSIRKAIEAWLEKK